MTAVQIAPEDLSPFIEIDALKAWAMIEDAMALAARVAPCIVEDDFAYPEAAKAIIRGAILRWHETGTASLNVDAGSFGATYQQRQGMFWPAEIAQLSALCGGGGASGRAYMVDMMPPRPTTALPLNAWELNL